MDLSFKHAIGSTGGHTKRSNTHSFCVYGTAELKMMTGFLSNGLNEMSFK